MVQMSSLATAGAIPARGAGTRSVVHAAPNAGARRQQQGWTIAVPDWCAVMHFMDRYPFLRPVVQAAYGKIPAYFTQVHVTVGVIDDPATPDNSHLTLALAVSDAHDEAARRFAAFGAEWLQGALGRTQGKMTVVLLPQPGPADARL